MDRPFCDSDFWNSNLTWYTSTPELSPCFQDTVLVWIPCAFLWLFFWIEIQSFYNGRKTYVQWSYLNITKTVISASLIIISILKMIFTIYYDVHFYSAEFTASLVKCLTYILVLTLVVQSPKFGIRRSGVQFVFWLLSTVAGIPVSASHFIFLRKQGFISNLTTFVLWVCEFVSVCAMFLFSFISDNAAIYHNPSDLKETSPEETASFISNLLYTWINNLILKGYKGNIKSADDVFVLRDRFRSKSTGMCLESNLHKENSSLPLHTNRKSNAENGAQVESRSLNQAHRNAHVGLALVRAFGPSFVLPVSVQLAADLLSFASPVLIQWLIEFASSDEPLWIGFFYVAVMFCCDIIANLCSEYRVKGRIDLESRIRTSISALLYRKSIRLSSSGGRAISSGQLLNCMSVDTLAFRFFLLDVHYLLCAPVQIAVGTALLWRTLGISSLAGVALIFLILPFNHIISKYKMEQQRKRMIFADKRVKLMNELMTGIRILKLYGWEKPFQKQAQQLREKEATHLKYLALTIASFFFVWHLVPPLVSFISFTVYLLADEANILTPATAFVSLRLFAIINWPLSRFPELISGFASAYVSLSRINKVLRCEELENYVKSSEISADNDPAIDISDGSFSWCVDSTATLSNINFTIPRGALVAVLGRVASGKTSLLSAILSDMEKLKGRVAVRGSIAYVPQQAWIRNATFRNNVLFERSFDRQKYEEIIEACELDEDVDILPAFDETEIGEKGINLSGGQKQRVSLARACYLDKDIYLLDDPLGAVDSHTAKHVFEKVIGPEGLLRNKTRILVTHNVDVLRQVDTIYVLKDGAISWSGTYDDVMDKNDTVLNCLTDSLHEDGVNGRVLNGNREEKDYHPKWKNTNSGLENEKTEQNNISEKKLILEEKFNNESTFFSLCSQYFNLVGWAWCLIILATFICFCASLILTNYWLILWSEDSVNDFGNFTRPEAWKTNMRMSVYGGLGLMQAALVFLAIVLLFLRGLRASIKMHFKMLLRVLKSPLSFFDTTPIGRVLNRFSKDIQETDHALSYSFYRVISFSMKAMSFAIAIAIEVPTFLVGFLISTVTVFVIQRFYVPTNRQLKGLVATSSSPVFTHFADTLAGRSVIRSLGATELFIDKAHALIDKNEAITYCLQMSMRWMSLRITLLGSVVIFIAALCGVFARGLISPGEIGYILNNAYLIAFLTQVTVVSITEMESLFVSLERIFEYFQLKSEAPWENLNSDLPKRWPEEGKIIFRQYSTRYREGLSVVLNNVSFTINSMEKVGVVGRTGAGKSSLSLALFRMIEAASGEIVIDGVNLESVGLQDLRSRLTIIPQDPVLFAGTLRFNLDPFEQHDDERIWTALEQSHLKHFVMDFEKGLEHEIAESGQNLSIGQRQLVCLARALLRNTKILILDEATASVDLETDKLIQATIRKEFLHCTIVTIAHRINTIMDYDRVLVLDQGTVVEFDKPEILRQDSSSYFYELCKDAGLLSLVN